MFIASTVTKVFAGCFLMPVLMVASCAGKMYFDARMYELPGEVLRSPSPPTQKLTTALLVAQTLDTYVQPRFEILRDKNFGATRIIYRKHAGIVQLKVDTPQEKQLIANVEATHRDYAICLLHCAPKPPDTFSDKRDTPELEPLYFNRQQIASERDLRFLVDAERVVPKQLPWEAIEKKAISALRRLQTEKEYRAEVGSWTMLMRPVLAAEQTCLDCHTGAKPNATLGVMVYLVRSDNGQAAAAFSTAIVR